MKMKNFDSQGFTIGHQIWQTEVEHNTLFIHGNLASSAWWLPALEVMGAHQVEAFSDGKGKALCADWRGYGASTGLSSKQEINFETFADDYLRLVDHYKLKDINVVGHSTGGYIAMLAILKRPDLFRSCVLLDSVSPKGIQLELPLEQVLAHFQTMSENRDYCTQVLAATIESVDPTSEMFKDFVETSWSCDKVMWQGVIEKLCTETDISDRVGEISIPTLVLHGRKDLVLPLKGAELTAELLPQAELKVIEEAGHSYNVEDPENFIQIAEDFWQSISEVKQACCKSY